MSIFWFAANYVAFLHYPLKPILSLIQRDLSLRVGQYGKGSSLERFWFCSVSVLFGVRVFSGSFAKKHDPEMTQKMTQKK